jgi:hypothetical protein
MPSNQPGEYEPASWTEIFCQCLPVRKTKPSAEPDIEMQDMHSSQRWSTRSTSLARVNNPVVPNHIVRANNPDNIQRPSHNSHNSWWLRDDDEAGPSAPPSRSGARNPIASTLSDTPGPSDRPRTKNPYTVTWLDTAPRHASSSSSTYSSSGPSWNLPSPESVFSSHSDLPPTSPTSRDVRVPRISPRAVSYTAVLDVQAGIDARRSEVPQPPSPTGSVDSIDFFSGAAHRPDFGGRVERSGGRVVASTTEPPVRPKRFEGVSPYVA